MAKTLWLPAPDSGRTATQTWLLQNGDTVQHPALEISASGRRVRFAGDTTSVGVNQVPELIKNHAQRIAAPRGTKLWMRLPPTDSTTWLIANQALSPHENSLQFAEGSRVGYTDVVWEFQHPTMPVGAIVVVRLYSRYSRHEVNTWMAYRSTLPGDGENMSAIVARDGSHKPPLFSLGRWDGTHGTIETWLNQEESKPEALPHISWGWHTEGGQSVRGAAETFFERCRQINELAQVYIPDLRDPDNPQWLALDLVRTNYTSEFEHELINVASIGPQLDQLQAAVESVVKVLRTGGIVVNPPTDKAFAKALSGDTSQLTVEIKPDGSGQHLDSEHLVMMNLATGTVTVTCTHKHEEEIAQAYESAKFIATLKGDEDEILAYAREYVKRKAEQHTREIVDARVDLSKRVSQ